MLHFDQETWQPHSHVSSTRSTHCQLQSILCVACCSHCACYTARHNQHTHTDTHTHTHTHTHTEGRGETQDWSSLVRMLSPAGHRRNVTITTACANATRCHLSVWMS